MDLARFRLGVSRRGWTSLVALSAYCVVSFLYFGLRILIEPGRNYIGYDADPQIFIWSFAWWPHAILHGENPFITHAIWSPDGVNLTWATSVPGLALLFAPLTLLAGAFVSYNVAAVLLPALAAWTGFLLCRHLTRAFWPSLVGGYLFGFSSYLIGQTEGHQHMTSVFLIPLVGLVIVRYLEGELSGRRLAVRLGPLFALQLLFSTEVTFTLALAMATAFVLGLVLAPRIRRRLISLLAPIAAAAALAAVLTAPFIYYALTGFQSGAINWPDGFTADLLNFAVPTNLAWSGHGWADAISNNFPGNDSEQGAYLGLPALVIVTLFARRRWRTPAGRFLLAAFGLAVLAALGFKLTVDGRQFFSLSLPWALIGHHALFNNVLPVRFALYISLVAAVIVALWTASRTAGVLRWLLPALAVLVLVPNPSAGVWATRFSVPQFFTDSADRTCLDPGENILPLPVGSEGDAMLWQVASGFRFNMAGGRIAPAPPPSFETPDTVAAVAEGHPVPPEQAETLIMFIQLKRVTSVVVDAGKSEQWAGALNRIATPQRIDGVLLYHVAAAAPSCLGG